MFVDHSSINRWAIWFLPLLEKVFRKHKRQVGGSWRVDETCILVKDAWKYLYRAVDKEGRAVDFLLTARRDKAAAMRFFDKAMQANTNSVLAGIELMHMIRKSQLMLEGCAGLSFVDQFYALAGQIRQISRVYHDD